MLARDIEMFIEHCGLKGLSTKTINSYEQTLRLFMQYMDEQGILLTEKITHLAIQGYIKSIKERGKYTVTTNPNSGNYPDRRVDFGKRVSDMQSILSFISAHWMEWAIGLLSFGWGYLIKKMTEYKNIKDGLLAIMHDRLYQMSTFFLKEGYINTAALKNLEYLYNSYHALGGNGTGTELYTRAKGLPIKED